VVLIKTRGKWDAAYSLLNLLLKDTHKYCNMCGTPYRPGMKPCCDQMQMGSHQDHLTAVVKQNKQKISDNVNCFGAGKKSSLRHCMSMPPVLYQEWSKAFFKLYEVKLFDTHKDMLDCMKKMPFLKTCERT